jgi:hypothetical protein
VPHGKMEPPASTFTSVAVSTPVIVLPCVVLQSATWPELLQFDPTYVVSAAVAVHTRS